MYTFVKHFTCNKISTLLLHIQRQLQFGYKQDKGYSAVALVNLLFLFFFFFIVIKFTLSCKFQ